MTAPERKFRAWMIFGLALNQIFFSYLYYFKNSASVLNSKIPICWPFFERCAAYRQTFISLQPYLFMLLATFAIFAVLTLFRARDRDMIPKVLLTLSFFVKLILVIQDYRFMGNFHYIQWWMLAALWLPQSERVATALLVLFYFFSGLLKFQSGWIDGTFFAAHPMIGTTTIKFASLAVMYLEIILVWLLFSRSRWIRTSILMGLLLFHVASTSFISIQFPLVMLFLLIPFFMSQLGPAIQNKRAASSLMIWLLPLIFILFQAVPLAYKGNSSITGEGRMFSVNLFDGFNQCERVFLLTEGSEVEEKTLDLRMGRRIQCDPLIDLNIINHVCRKSNNRNAHYTYRLVVKPYDQSVFYPLLDLQGSCKEKLALDWLKPNRWIYQPARDL